MTTLSVKDRFLLYRPDRALFVDAPPEAFSLTAGEVVAARYPDVRDLQASVTLPLSLQKGDLVITSLRISWAASNGGALHNFLVGLSTITRLSVGKARAESEEMDQSSVRRKTLILHATYGGAQYRFDLQPATPGDHQLFDTIQMIYRAHDASHLHRRFRVRFSLLRGGSVVLFSNELVKMTRPDVVLTSMLSGKPALGTLLLTTHRLLWYADGNPAFNLSLPYIHIEGLTLCPIPEETLLVFIRPDETPASAIPEQGRNRKKPKVKTDSDLRVLGLECKEIKKAYETLLQLIESAIQAPDYGMIIDYESNSPEAAPIFPLTPSDRQPPSNGVQQALTALIAARSSKYPRRAQPAALNLVYDEKLGVAFEAPPGISRLQDLWTVL
ncbi:Basal body protein, BBS5 [Giardia muris]|uniref:Basal body protein, BBS5 n=1 Tax=Giardia muris TaxID=5742 RepID=A0A4Z1SPC0_GIAMU|nr:Basal body protein, BBS5 [Giardia muris]|eukprot:TNJ27656.1 Basal body protein, BBS5 [Giardia muris]